MASKNLPSVGDIRATAQVVSLRLNTKFRGLTEREIMVFEGPNGWTEWSPFVEYSDAEAATWLAAAIEFGWHPSLAPAAFSGDAKHSSIRVNATLPAVSAEQVAEVLGRFDGFETVKIKVAEAGQTLEQDIERIEEVSRLYPAAKIRLDANGGYSVATARSLAARLLDQGVNLEYLEQPVATVAEMAELRIYLQGVGVKIAADESVRKASDPLEIARAGAADLLVLKAAPLGGILRATEIAAEAGLPVVVSSALESSVGLSMGAHLAAHLSANLADFGFDAGLGTANLLATDITLEPLKPHNSKIDVRRVEVDADLLTKQQAAPDRAQWWFDRLERSLQHLETNPEQSGLL